MLEDLDSYYLFPLSYSLPTLQLSSSNLKKIFDLEILDDDMNCQTVSKDGICSSNML